MLCAGEGGGQVWAGGDPEAAGRRRGQGPPGDRGEGETTHVRAICLYTPNTHIGGHL